MSRHWRIDGGIADWQRMGGGSLTTSCVCPSVRGAACRSINFDARWELFFVDYDMIPLMVQQAYPNSIQAATGEEWVQVQGVCRRAHNNAAAARHGRCDAVAVPCCAGVPEVARLNRLVRAADAISDADIIADYVSAPQDALAPAAPGWSSSMHPHWPLPPAYRHLRLQVRGKQAWGLLPSMASCYTRATGWAAGPVGVIPFPMWLGKNSTR